MNQTARCLRGPERGKGPGRLEGRASLTRQTRAGSTNVEPRQEQVSWPRPLGYLGPVLSRVWGDLGTAGGSPQQPWLHPPHAGGLYQSSDPPKCPQTLPHVQREGHSGSEETATLRRGADPVDPARTLLHPAHTCRALAMPLGDPSQPWEPREDGL